MAVFESKAHSLLLSMLEVAAILRKPEGSIFSSKGFKLYQVYIWVSLSTLITSCFFFVLNEEGNIFMAIVLGTGTLQYLVCNLLLLSKKKVIQEMLDASTEVFHQLTPNVETRRKMEFVDKMSHKFAKPFTLLMCMNIITGAVQGLFKTWLSGQTSFPFEESCLGLPAVPCWFVQIFTTGQIAIYISSYFSILKIIIYQLQGYADVLSKMIRDRPVNDDKKNDRNILKLYCDFSRQASQECYNGGKFDCFKNIWDELKQVDAISNQPILINSFAALFANIFGITAFVEVTFTTVRCCFQSYHVMMTVSNKDWGNASGSILIFASSFVLTYIVCSCGEDMDAMNNLIRNGFLESKWYKCSPESRKRLLPILTLSSVPIRFHYRCFMYFNMERLLQVLRSTYSLITALANFM